MVWVCALPHLKIEMWGTYFCGELKETAQLKPRPDTRPVGLGLSDPTQAKLGWGTNFCGELKEMAWLKPRPDTRPVS
jgi:hypothetical protein